MSWHRGFSKAAGCSAGFQSGGEHTGSCPNTKNNAGGEPPEEVDRCFTI
jgi:hypothetical protein